MAKNKEKQIPTAEDDMAATLLLKEADELLRQDQLQALWDEWGSTIIGVALMIVLGTSIGVGFQKWRTSVHATQTANLIEYSSDTSADVDLKGPYKGIADIVSAAEIATKGEGNATEISALLEEAADSDLPREWDIMAQWGSLRTRADASDDVAVKLEVADKMAKLAKKSSNPYAPAILMEAALIKGENGQALEAITLLERAKADPATEKSPMLAKRINDYMELYKTESAQ